MIIPSVDILDGEAVQLRGGKREGGEYPKLNLGKPELLAARYARVGEFAVVDLNAAFSEGNNWDLIAKLCHQYRVRVGGGIRDIDTAHKVLNAGASKIMIGTKATPEFLQQLPRERVIAALDIRGEEVFVEGWTRGSGLKISERINTLKNFVSGFLITFIENEGSLKGINLHRAAELIALAAPARITFAGGLCNLDEIQKLDSLGADVQVGTALALGKIDLGEAFASCLISDRPDGLFATVVCDEHGRNFGLVYSSKDSICASIEHGKGIYYSRKRGLWYKGESSGDIQDLIRIETDCDRDAIKFTVHQNGQGFCHTGSWTCFGTGSGLELLNRTIAARLQDAPAGSYTKRLFSEAGLLEAKIREEASELCEATGVTRASEEAADLFYFALARVIKEGGSLRDIEDELDRRAHKVTRRKGDAKPGYLH